MLHDLRGSYIRRESYHFPRDGLSVLEIALFLTASALISAVLIFAAVRWGVPAVDVDVAALYAP